MRKDARKNDELREIKIEVDFIKNPLSSTLFSQGNTIVLSTVSLIENTAPHLKGTGSGWITAEYSLLPGSTSQRKQRERFKVSGRTFEIQRFIGRSLRSVVDLPKLGERTIYVDCDVIQADGGTRCASINASFIALCIGFKRLIENGELSEFPVSNKISAVSSGKVEGEYLLDLNYEEDSIADVDGNFVFADDGNLVELQVQGEESTFSYEEFQELFNLSKKGSFYIFEQMNKIFQDYEIGFSNKK